MFQYTPSKAFGGQVGLLGPCSAGAAAASSAIAALAAEGLLDCGLLAGERPAADVAELLAARTRIDAVLAMRLAAAEDADALPFPRHGDTAVTARWAPRAARAMSRAGRLANAYPSLGALWLAGAITWNTSTRSPATRQPCPLPTWLP